MTIGIDYGVVKCGDVSVSIFDVGGHELFREVRQEFYADTEAVLLVFDARDHHPVTSLNRWLAEFVKFGGKVDKALVIVAANKCDLAGQNDLTDARIWAEQQGFKFVQTSGLFNLTLTLIN